MLSGERISARRSVDGPVRRAGERALAAVLLFSLGCSAADSHRGRVRPDVQWETQWKAPRREGAPAQSTAGTASVDGVEELRAHDDGETLVCDRPVNRPIIVGWSLVGVGALIVGAGAPMLQQPRSPQDPPPGIDILVHSTLTALVLFGGLAMMVGGSVVTVRGYRQKRQYLQKCEELRQRVLGAPQGAEAGPALGIPGLALESGRLGARAPVPQLGVEPWVSGQGGGMSLRVVF